jgi:hypothetical protein
MLFAPFILDQAAIISLDVEWWQKEPRPTTETGTAELMSKGLILLQIHAENILTEIRAARTRLMLHAHLRNSYGITSPCHSGTLEQVRVDLWPDDGMQMGTVTILVQCSHVECKEVSRYMRTQVRMYISVGYALSILLSAILLFLLLHVPEHDFQELFAM